MFQVSRIVRYRVSLVLLLGLLDAGCSRCADKTVNPSRMTTVNPPSVAWETPSDDECRLFAESLEKAMLAGNVDAFVAAVDWDSMLDRATASTEASEKDRHAFIASAKESLIAPGSNLRHLVQQAANGNFRFLCVQTAGKEKQVVFRVLAPDGRWNYYRLVLGHTTDSRVRAVDWYFIGNGMVLSQYCRRMFLPVVAATSQSALARLTQSEKDFIRNADKFKQISIELRNGRNEQVLKIYATLPPSLQKEKFFLLARTQAAAVVGEKEHLDALEAFQAYCPGDPCLDVLLIDHYRLKKQFDRALASIDTLDKAVGGDPYLNVLRARMHIEKNDFAKARECAQKAVAAEDTLQLAYWSLITACLGSKDFAETNRLLTAVQEKCGAKIDDLTTIPVYAEYVKSPEYKEWLEKQRRKEVP